MQRIIIIGYMGAGKTTVGKALSKEMGITFYDLDWYIESRMRKTVKQIFDERGEEGFRTIERNMLHEVAEFEDVIISCGGGTPCFLTTWTISTNKEIPSTSKRPRKYCTGTSKWERLYVHCSSIRHRRKFKSSLKSRSNNVKNTMQKPSTRLT